MTRNLASAKAAGTRFERSIADCLKAHVSPFIDRRVKTGAKDKGDIANLMAPLRGHVAVECKDVSRTNLGGWVREAEVERSNDAAIAGLVIHKRRGHGDPLDQYVTCTVRDLIAILTGERP